MTISIGDRQFEGPYLTLNNLQDTAGVYVIIDYVPSETGGAGNYYVIDVGESAKVRTRLENHDRKPCWTRTLRGTLAYAVLYTPYFQQPGRVIIEQKIRRQYEPACGIR